MDFFYKEKYLKYKKKYLNLKNQIGSRNLSDLPDELSLPIFDNLNCKETIKRIIADPKTIKDLKPEQWKQLADKIKVDDKYKQSSEYLSNICKGEESCKLFYAKCLHQHLIEKYKKTDLIECWYESIRQGKT